MQTHRICNRLNETAVGTSGQDLVSTHPERKFSLAPNLAHLADKLHRELLLPDVIVGLDHEAYEFPSRQVLEGRLLSDANLLLFGSLEKDVALCSAVVKVNFADN